MTLPSDGVADQPLSPRAIALLELLVTAASSGNPPNPVTGIGGSRFQFLSLSRQSGRAIVMHPDLPADLPNGRRGLFTSPHELARIAEAEVVEIIAGSIEAGWAVIEVIPGGSGDVESMPRSDGARGADRPASASR